MCLNGFVLGNTGVMLAVQASLTSKARLGLAVGIVGAGSATGRALGPIIGAGLIHLVDVRGMLLVDAVLALVMGVLLTVLIREPARRRPVGLSAWAILGGALQEIRSHPLVWRLFLSAGLALLGTWVLLPFLPIFIAEEPGAWDAATRVGVVLTAAGAAAALSSPLWGQLLDRFGAIPVLTLTSLGGAACLVAAAAGGGLWVLASCLVGYSLFGAAIQTGIMALLARVVSPDRRGAVLGQVYFPFYVAGLVGPVLGGLLFPAGRWLLFLAGAGLTLLPLAVLYSARGLASR
jgi:MFS family permease